jgi:hypothetical protein
MYHAHRISSDKAGKLHQGIEALICLLAYTPIGSAEPAAEEPVVF